MNKLLLALGALLAGALLIPDMAEAQRGGRGGGGARMGGGGFGGGGFRGGGSFGGGGFGGNRMYIPRGGVGGAGVGMGNRGYRGAAIAARPGRVSRHWPRWPLRQPHRQRPLRRALLWSLRALPLLRRSQSLLWRILWGLSVLWCGCRAGHGQHHRGGSHVPVLQLPILHIPDAGRVSRWRILRNLRSGHVPWSILLRSGPGAPAAPREAEPAAP